MTTPTDIVNQSILMFGNDQDAVTGVFPTFDNSPAGIAAQRLYGSAVRTIARQFEWDFERHFVALALSGNAAPEGWAFEYVYPADAVEVWQLIPAAINPNNPLPQNWSVGNAMVAGVPAKVIWSNTAGATSVYANMPPPDVWDPLFRESVVRLLASEFAIAIAGKADTARDLLEQAGGFAQIGVTRDD